MVSSMSRTERSNGPCSPPLPIDRQREGYRQIKEGFVLRIDVVRSCKSLPRATVAAEALQWFTEKVARPGNPLRFPKREKRSLPQEASTVRDWEIWEASIITVCTMVVTYLLWATCKNTNYKKAWEEKKIFSLYNGDCPGTWPCTDTAF